MSLVGMLAAVSSQPTSLVPPTSDPIVAQIRPNGRSIAELTVAPSGADYTTIKAAATAAGVLQAARMAAEGTARITPNYRVDIIVEPGTYIGEVTSPQFVAYYGNGARGSVILNQDVNAALPLVGVLATAGNIYWENIDIVELLETPYVQVGGVDYPKYPVHGINRGTSVFVGCTLEHKRAAGTPYGSDGVNGGTTLFYDVDMLPGNTNLHGEAATRVPQTAMYVDCTSAGTVNWNALNNIAVDHLWVVGGNVYGVSLAGTASRLHLDPATVVGAGGITKPTGSQDADTNWPIPIGGLSATDRAYYGM